MTPHAHVTDEQNGNECTRNHITSGTRARFRTDALEQHGVLATEVQRVD